jgi:hypothetical protein
MGDRIVKLRTQRHLISLGYFALSNVLLVGIAAIIGSSGGDSDGVLAGLILVNHALVFLLPGYRRIIQRLFISTIHCPNCGLMIGMRGLWGCGGCGFNTVRHLLARCPDCKTYTDQIQCPQCKVSIHV